jgi:hypothetical protein
VIQINGYNGGVPMINERAEPRGELVTDPSTEDRLAKASEPAEEALHLHPYCRGKVQMMSKCSVGGLEDISTRYTPV